MGPAACVPLHHGPRSYDIVSLMCARLAGVLALSVFLAIPLSAQPPHYVGSTVCRNCHGPLVQAFYRNPHFKSIASGKEKPENTGCEGCHGPASDHVDADGGSDTIPNAFSLLPPNKILDTCL